MSESDGAARRRRSEPRPLRDILAAELETLGAGDEARAYAAWLSAAGKGLEGCARPLRFSRGTLTIACRSSVWANELHYQSEEILARMIAASPNQPVKRLRFIVDQGA